MSVPEPRTPVEEGRHHTYIGTTIPWYVRLMWIAFWVMAISYLIIYQLPALKRELITPP